MGNFSFASRSIRHFVWFYFFVHESFKKNSIWDLQILASFINSMNQKRRKTLHFGMKIFTVNRQMCNKYIHGIHLTKKPLRSSISFPNSEFTFFLFDSVILSFIYGWQHFEMRSNGNECWKKNYVWQLVSVPSFACLRIMLVVSNCSNELNKV